MRRTTAAARARALAVARVVELTERLDETEVEREAAIRDALLAGATAVDLALITGKSRATISQLAPSATKNVGE